jgi:hypothetical protein
MVVSPSRLVESDPRRFGLEAFARDGPQMAFGSTKEPIAKPNTKLKAKKQIAARAAIPLLWAEPAYHKLIYFNEVDKCGHFAAWEQP